MEVKNSERNRELENSASLEPRVCEVLLYYVGTFEEELHKVRLKKHIKEAFLWEEF